MRRDNRDSISTEDPTRQAVAARDGSSRGSASDLSDRTQAVSADVASSDVVTRGGISLCEGDTLGPYRVCRILGQGGMGAVYLAVDTRLGRNVALKLLRPDADARDEDLARLRREARSLAVLSHPNVVQVYGVEEADDCLCVAMEYVPGQDLKVWLETKRQPAPAVLELFVQAGRGLAAAHEAGLVHRDFKPANVLVGDDGRVRVVDFGLARMFGQAASRFELSMGAADTPAGIDDSLTQGQTAAGTPRYMAPEQHAGHGADARADQYAFCVALVESLIGERLFVRPDLEQQKERGPAPQHLRKLPRWLRAPLERGLSPNPSDRFTTMDDLLARLERRRRNNVPIAVAVTIAPGVLWAAQIDDRCNTGSQAIEDAWTKQQRGLLVQALQRTPQDREAVERTTKALDSYAGRWARTYSELCESRETRHPVVYDDQIACLRDRARAFDAQVDAIVAGDATNADKAIEAVVALPSVETCADDARIRGAPEPPEPLREVVDQLSERLERVRAQTRLGAYDKAYELAQMLLGDAVEVGFAPLLHEARTQLADTMADVGRYDEALALLEHVYHDAKSHSAMEPAIDSGIGIASLIRHARSDLDQAKWWARHVRSDLVSTPDDHRRWARLLELEGVIAFHDDELERAATLYELALQRLGKIFPANSPEVLGVRGRLAQSWTSLGRVTDAIAMQEDILQKMTSLLGSEHPALVDVVGKLAWAYHHSGDTARATQLYRRVIELRTRALGPEHWELMLDWVNLAAVSSASEDMAAAEAAFEQASRLSEQALEHGQVLQVVSLRYNLGTFYLRNGQLERARGMYYEALEATTPEMKSARITLMHGMAHFESTAGRFDAATVWYEKAWDEIVRSGQERTTQAGSLFLAWAHTDWSAGRFADALAHADRGLEIHAAVSGQRTPHILEGIWIRARALQSVDPEASAAAFEQALQLAEAEGYVDVPDLALELAVLIEKTEPERALALVQRGLSHAAARDTPRAHQQVEALREWLARRSQPRQNETP